MIRLDANTHFNKGDRVVYRRRLTIMMFVSTGCTIVALKFGSEMASWCAISINVLHSFIWIWE